MISLTFTICQCDSIYPGTHYSHYSSTLKESFPTHYARERRHKKCLHFFQQSVGKSVHPLLIYIAISMMVH
jgi:hypothetical protein